MRASALIAFSFAHALFAQSGSTVEGTVTNSITGAGVPGVTVRLFSQQGAHYETITDQSGNYSIAGMPPGEYDSRFEKTGFGELQTDVSQSLAAPRLNVSAAKDALRLNHQLAPLATVRGRVLSVDGQPAANVEVTIALGPAGLTRTDSNGAFTFDKLRPGSYALRASPPAAAAVVRDGVRIETVTTFYPSATDRGDAQMIDVRGGSDQSGLEIRLQEAPVYRVRGVIEDDAGKPVAGAYVTLASFATGSYLTGQMMLGYPPAARYLLVGRLPATEEASFTTKDDGHFEFPSVRSGDWRIRAESAPARDPATNRDVMWSGQASALVARHDLDDVEIRLAPPFTRDGSVDWSGLPRVPADRRAYVRLVAPDSGAMVLGFALPNGGVHFENLAAGRYRVAPLSALTPGYYPAALFLGDQDVTGQEVDLNAASPPLRLVMKAGPGTIRGTVENGAGATILLAPQSAADPDVLLAVACGAGGAYQIQGVPPGDYSIVAFDRLGAEQGASIQLPAILAAATSVHVDEGATATVPLQVNRWPE